MKESKRHECREIQFSDAMMNGLWGMDSSEKSGHVHGNMAVSEESHSILETVNTHMRLTALGIPWLWFWLGTWTKGENLGHDKRKDLWSIWAKNWKDKTAYEPHWFKLAIHTPDNTRSYFPGQWLELSFWWFVTPITVLHLPISPKL